ncbi:molybdate ABC transporter substrate-binding protein [Croceicoccus marinus]|jgi:molybdate transport system substrate-binding protein|uniref:Molybdate ABC transporter substrate-binding protein n=1 Tax=Croceicoccus marinus TaxID=450378 RepID=A0A7G6VWA1_9SPHN|nr:molybdate ABC transporter substrate-binding protein [Croceicoccus marinus]QNE06016.1 molybdate ABC transporter substrate-binding protein [Croceicoccus marinus]
MSHIIRPQTIALTLAVAALLALLAWQAAPSQEGDERAGPIVLAAASMHDALEDAADAWVRQGHARPVLSFAASSAAARQIEAGAPADLFVSADEEWMDELEGRDLLVEGSREVLATNRLVLIAPAGSNAEIAPQPGFALAEALEGGRLAVAETESVPAGRYAKAALVELGVWNEVADRLAPAENVRAALQLVARGAAPLGITYASDALASPGVKALGEFPAGSHPPIRYPLALVAAGGHPQAEAFRGFLLSPQGAAILARHGFGPAERD